MNLSKLRRAGAKLTRPTTYVPCPELKDWLFADGEKPQLKVRGLNSNDQLLVREETKKQEEMKRIAQALTPSTPNGTAVKDALLTVLGAEKGELSKTLPYLIQLVLFGVVDEEGKRLFEIQDVAILHEHFPVTFLELTGAISRLMGQPSESALGESSRASGATPRSEMPSPSVSTSESASMSADPTSSPTGS